MKQALAHLLNDLLSAILFLAVYLATANITVAAAIGVAAGLGQIAVQRFRGRRIWPMQWISLAVVIVLSAASIATQSPRFVMLKPSLGHFAIAAAMLKRGWMSRYLPDSAVRHLPVNAPVIAGYAWAGLMAGLGLANILIALYAPFAIWVWFISVGAVGAKVAAFLLQYAVFRTIVRRRLRRAPGAAVAAAILTAAILLTKAGGADAVGFQQAAAPDPEGQPLELNIWYPSDAPATPNPLGLYQQLVASEAPITGSRLPLIVISHGTGGGAETYYDTALALAEAGFVVAAPAHSGDNWRDRSYSFTARNFVERSRHIKLVIDYLLTRWSGWDHLDAGRIGAFGHSAGGFTVLVAIGGNPEFARMSAFCSEHPDDWGCHRARERVALAGRAADPPAPVWVHDDRIKAAVIAATAAGYAFSVADLAGVRAPVQLWEAENDRIVLKESIESIAANLPSPPETHLVPAAGHFAFLAPCSDALAARVPEICQDPPGFDRTAFHRDFNMALVAFFKKQLVPVATRP